MMIVKLLKPENNWAEARHLDERQTGHKLIHEGNITGREY